MSMRKLNFKDLFAAAEIIRKAKIRSELAALISGISAEKSAKTGENSEKDVKGDKIVEKVGISFMLMLIEAAPAVENEIYALVASIKGVGVQDVQDMSLDTLVRIAAALEKRHSGAIWLLKTTCILFSRRLSARRPEYS